MLNRRFPKLSRREFNTLAGAAGLSLGLGGPGFAADAPDSAKAIIGKKSGLIVHNAKLGVMETPLALLRPHALTPKNVLFTRMHFPHEGEAAWYATTDAPHRDWTLQIDGLVQYIRSLK